MAANIICQPCDVGGLGLIDVIVQAKAFSLRVFMWGLQPGEHLLQSNWVRFQFAKMAEETFGISTLAGLLANHTINQEYCFPVLFNMLLAWHFFSKELII